MHDFDNHLYWQFQSDISLILTFCDRKVQLMAHIFVTLLTVSTLEDVKDMCWFEGYAITYWMNSIIWSSNSRVFLH